MRNIFIPLLRVTPLVIPSLLSARADGSITENMNQIVGDFSKFYYKLFGKYTTRNAVDWDVFKDGEVLSMEEQANLVHKVTEEEIKAAIFGIGNEKAPGPDGFPGGFFKKNWDTFGDDVTSTISKFLEKRLILREFNHTSVILIPKKFHVPTVVDFRPIACTNVVYKVITKIITNRMALLLGEIINPAQSAFVKGKNLSDNYLVDHVMVRRYERTQLALRCMVKINLQKAYDSISWYFLREVFIGLRFHPCFIHWILTCVICPTFSLSINGGSHGLIKGKRGLRQGDPMSSSLHGDAI